MSTQKKGRGGGRPPQDYYKIAISIPNTPGTNQQLIAYLNEIKKSRKGFQEWIRRAFFLQMYLDLKALTVLDVSAPIPIGVSSDGNSQSHPDSHRVDRTNDAMPRTEPLSKASIAAEHAPPPPISKSQPDGSGTAGTDDQVTSSNRGGIQADQGDQSDYGDQGSASTDTGLSHLRSVLG